MAKKPKKELEGHQMSTSTKVIIAIFAVIMSLSMMLPSLASIFASNNASDAQEEEAESDSTEAEESADDETEEDADADEAANEEADELPVPDNDTLKDLADQYANEVERYQGRLDKDPNNLAALLNLGQVYMNWGYSAQYSSSTDEETEYSKALLQKAADYFDRYLEQMDSEAARVQRISCDYYLGNTEEALAAMVAMTEQDPDYGLAWAHLGLFYEWQYDYQQALSAYTKAKETDPNDELGAKSFAEQHITSIQSSMTSFDDLTNEDLLGTDSQPEEGLPGVIAGESGL